MFWGEALGPPGAASLGPPAPKPGPAASYEGAWHLLVCFGTIVYLEPHVDSVCSICSVPKDEALGQPGPL